MSLLLFAQESAAPEVLHVTRLLLQPVSMFWLVAALCVVASTIYSLVQLMLTHRERLAMIRAGMHPDSPTPGSGPAATTPPADGANWKEWKKAQTNT